MQPSAVDVRASRVVALGRLALVLRASCRAVGDVCMRYFDAQRKRVRISLDERVVGVRADPIRAVRPARGQRRRRARARGQPHRPARRLAHHPRHDYRHRHPPGRRSLAYRQASRVSALPPQRFVNSSSRRSFGALDAAGDWRHDEGSGVGAGERHISFRRCIVAQRSGRWACARYAAAQRGRVRGGVIERGPWRREQFHEAASHSV
jgi:hypothetical protein